MHGLKVYVQKVNRILARTGVHLSRANWINDVGYDWVGSLGDTHHGELQGVCTEGEQLSVINFWCVIPTGECRPRHMQNLVPVPCASHDCYRGICAWTWMRNWTLCPSFLRGNWHVLRSLDWFCIAVVGFQGVHASVDRCHVGYARGACRVDSCYVGLARATCQCL